MTLRRLFIFIGFALTASTTIAHEGHKHAKPSTDTTVIHADLKALVAELKEKGKCEEPSHTTGNPMWCEKKCYGGSINLSYDRNNPAEEKLFIMAERTIAGATRELRLDPNTTIGNLSDIVGGTHNFHENSLPVCYAAPHPEDAQYKCNQEALELGVQLFNACLATKDGPSDVFESKDWEAAFEELWTTLPRLKKPE